MLDDSRRKRAAETEERLAALREAGRREVPEIAYHATREFLSLDEARERAFEPRSVGFS